MRIVMVGCGALGGLFAHHLALGGAELAVLDTDAAHVAAIQQHGLQLQTSAGRVASPLRAAYGNAAAVADALHGQTPDFLVLFTKTWASRAALAAAASLAGPQTVLVTLQNGLGNPQLLRECMPAQPVLYGLTTLTSDRLAPGVIEPRSTQAGVTDLWTLDAAQAEAGGALPRFVDVLQRGGIHARMARDIDRSVWKKLVVNCAFNGLCAVGGLRCGELLAAPGMRPVFDGIAVEVAQVARASGVALDDAEALAFLHQVADASRAHHPSMVDDLRQRRPTEIDSLNGAVCRQAERLGVTVTANRLVHALVRAVEIRNQGTSA